MNAAQQQPFSTLGEVNARLTELGFPGITPQKAAEIQQKVPKQRFITALQKAANEGGARQFLQNLLSNVDNAAGEQPNNAQSSGPANPPSSSPSAANGSHENRGAPANNTPATEGASRPQQPEQPEQPERGPAPAPSDEPARSAQEREYVSHHCYGSKAALEWEADETRNGLPTVSLDAAGATAPRQYNWQQKVRIQLTRQELPQVAAVLLGFSSYFKGSNHGVGDQKGKAFELTHQGDKVYVKVFGPNREAFSVPIFVDDLYDVTAIFLRQLGKGKPWLSVQEIILLIQNTVARLNHNANKNQN